MIQQRYKGRTLPVLGGIAWGAYLLSHFVRKHRIDCKGLVLRASILLVLVLDKVGCLLLLKKLPRPPWHISASFSLDVLLIFYHERVSSQADSFGVLWSGIRETWPNQRNLFAPTKVSIAIGLIRARSRTSTFLVRWYHFIWRIEVSFWDQRQRWWKTFRRWCCFLRARECVFPIEAVRIRSLVTGRLALDRIWTPIFCVGSSCVTTIHH